jgi:dTDP-4-dehydrorhamnose 3,5-epimerase
MTMEHELKLDGLLEGATRDGQSVTADWQPVGRQRIDGVEVVRITPVTKRAGVLTEVFRPEWSGGIVGHVFQVLLMPGAISAWHAHLHTVDRLFVSSGSLTLALYDARRDSPTTGLVNEMHLSIARPELVIVPAGVWHGLIVTGCEPTILLNLPDAPYHYEAPDHYRLPPDTPQIPYRFRPGDAIA